MWDVFVSHAAEDKHEVVRPLVSALQAQGLKVWLDTAELNVGDSLRQKIDEGLSKAQFGVVVLSTHFFRKKWPQLELDALMALERVPDRFILPVWHNLTADDVAGYSPIMASKIGVSTALGIDEVALRIVRALRVARKQEAQHWIRFDETLAPERTSIEGWLHQATSEIPEPAIAWPAEIHNMLARLRDHHPGLVAARECDGGDHVDYRGKKLSRHSVIGALTAQKSFDEWNRLLPVRLRLLALGLQEYGGGYWFAVYPARSLLLLAGRHVRNHLAGVLRGLSESTSQVSTFMSDLRQIARGQDMASAVVLYRQPGPAREEAPVDPFRMYGPRHAILAAPRNGPFLNPDLFEDFFMSQLEYRLLVAGDTRPITYCGYASCWDLSDEREEPWNPM